MEAKSTHPLASAIVSIHCGCIAEYEGTLPEVGCHAHDAHDAHEDNDDNMGSTNSNPDVSSFIKLIYSHNVNNIFACCNYTICDSLISLVKPSVISGENGEMISILYCTVLQHLSATEVACTKLGIAKVSALLQYMMSTHGEKCCINILA